MRIRGAVKNLSSPIPLWRSSACSGFLYVLALWDHYWLATLTHLASILRNFSFSKSWKCSRRGQWCRALRLCLSWDSGGKSLRQVWGSLFRAACGFSESNPGPSCTSCTSCTCPPLLSFPELWCCWMSQDSSEMVGSCRTAVGILCGCFCFLRKSCRDRQRWGLLTSQESTTCLAPYHQSSFWRGDEIQMLVLILIPDSEIAVWLSTLESLSVHSTAALSFTWESQKSLSSHLGEFLESISHPCSFF